MRAATVGDCRPGRTATRNRSESVNGARADATTQEIFARAAGRQQDAVIAEVVGGLSDLPQVVQIDIAASDAGAEITPVAMRRQEPQHVGVRRRGNTHDPDLRTALAMLIGLGMRPSAWKVSAMRCCSAMTVSSSGLMPYD